MTSVIVSGSGPSSRTDPPSTTSTPCSTQACMIPDVSTPCSTALAIEPQRHGVEGADVMLVAVLDADALQQVHAERGAVQGALDVVGGERVAGEQHVHVAGLDQPHHRRAG